MTEKFTKAALQMPTEDPTRTPITFTLTNEASAYIAYIVSVEPLLDVFIVQEALKQEGDK